MADAPLGIPGRGRFIVIPRPVYVVWEVKESLLSIQRSMTPVGGFL